jgi:hypothetical protein
MKDGIAVFMEKTPFFAFSVIMSIMSVIAQRSIGAMELMGSVPLSARVLVAFKALMMYLWKMVVPVHLVPYYPYPQNITFPSAEYVSAIILVIGITAVCFFVAKKQRAWLSIWGYFVVTLLPVLGIVQVGHHSMADRFTYLPALGLFLFAGLTAAWGWTKADALKQWGRMVKMLVAALMISLCLSLSYGALKQIAIWKSSIELMSYLIEHEPDSAPLAHFNRGNAYAHRYELDRAIDDYNAAIILEPAFTLAYKNRGDTYAEKGDVDAAINDYTKALSLAPDDFDAYIGRGNLYMKKGRTDLAVKDYQKACELGSGEGCSALNR